MTVKLGVKINVGRINKQKIGVKLNQTTINFGQILVKVKDYRLTGAAERVLPHLTPANAIIKLVR